MGDFHIAIEWSSISLMVSSNYLLIAASWSRLTSNIWVHYIIPAESLCNNNVVVTPKHHFDEITSKWRRFDVITTLLSRRVRWGVTSVVNCIVPFFDRTSMSFFVYNSNRDDHNKFSHVTFTLLIIEDTAERYIDLICKYVKMNHHFCPWAIISTSSVDKHLATHLTHGAVKSICFNRLMR